MSLYDIYNVELWRRATNNVDDCRQVAAESDQRRQALHNYEVYRSACFKKRCNLAVVINLNERIENNVRHNQQVVAQEKAAQVDLDARKASHSNDINANLKSIDDTLRKIRTAAAHVHGLKAAIASAGDDGEKYARSLHPTLGPNAIEALKAKYRQEYLDELGKKTGGVGSGLAITL